MIFTIGSIAWIGVAVASGQSNLLWSNAFLTAINLVGIWRWLGRQAHVKDAGKAEAARTRNDDAAPCLFALTGLAAMPVRDDRGTVVAKAVEAMVDGRSGRIDHVIVSTGGLGGIGEHYHRLPWDRIRIDETGMVTALDKAGIARLGEVRS